ncbi:hypothetical protein Emag_006787 [Eimeria magna]
MVPSRADGGFAPSAFPYPDFLEIRQAPKTSVAGEQLTTSLPPVATPAPSPPAASQQTSQQTASPTSSSNALPPAAVPSADVSSASSSAAPQQQPLNGVLPASSPAATNSKPYLAPVAFRAAPSAPVSPPTPPASSAGGGAASPESHVIVQRASSPAAASQQAAAPQQVAGGSSGASPLSRCCPCVDAARVGASSSFLPQDLLAEAQGRLDKSESHIAWVVLLGATVVCFFLLAVGVLWVASAYLSLNLERPNKQAAAQAAASAAAPSRSRQRPDFDFNARSLRSPSRRFDTQPQGPRPYSSSPSLSIRAPSPPGGASNA